MHGNGRIATNHFTPRGGLFAERSKGVRRGGERWMDIGTKKSGVAVYA